mmetsp:Transcript_99810/g.253808  ORF Transcript_99810/g.253808 Transcript_99810/m.253808 type:complete len:300 (-) Transcript_99810:449-1348(-)
MPPIAADCGVPPHASPTSLSTEEIRLMATWSRASKAACRAPSSAICSAASSSAERRAAAGEIGMLFLRGDPTCFGDSGPNPALAMPELDVTISTWCTGFRWSPNSRPTAGLPACNHACKSVSWFSGDMQFPHRANRSSSGHCDSDIWMALAPLLLMSFCCSSSSLHASQSGSNFATRMASRSPQRRAAYLSVSAEPIAPRKASPYLRASSSRSAPSANALRKSSVAKASGAIGGNGLALQSCSTCPQLPQLGLSIPMSSTESAGFTMPLTAFSNSGQPRSPYGVTPWGTCVNNHTEMLV